MPTRRVTFVVPYKDSDKSDGDLDDYDSDYKDAPDPEEEEELDLDQDIILLEDNDDLFNSNSEPEEGTSFVDIEEFLAHLALVEPPELSPALIPELPPNLVPRAPLKAHSYYDDGTRIQALTLQD
jgi:hypothetical protein